MELQDHSRTLSEANEDINGNNISGDLYAVSSMSILFATILF